MVKIKLKEKSLDEPKIIRRGGVTYSITSTEEIDMPLRYAAYIIDSTMQYGFVPSDKSDLISASGDLLRVVLNLENASTIDAVIGKYYPKKLSKVESKPEPKEEPKVEEKPKTTTKPKTESKAGEKPAPKKKGRPPKKKTDTSSSTTKAKKTKKTTTKEE